MKKEMKLPFVLLLLAFSGIQLPLIAQPNNIPAALKIGYSIDIRKIDSQSMNYARANGISCIEIAGINGLIDKNTRTFKMSRDSIVMLLRNAKFAAQAAGIDIWSIHMPYSDSMDISLPSEQSRQAVVAFEKQIMDVCKVLQPSVILFHPSYYLGLNQRALRKSQFIKSAIELNQIVKGQNAIMVVENMLGPQLLKDEKRERPLGRSVQEVEELMSLLSTDIYSAIDMNHIKHPESLITAMGTRLKSVHIADGGGEEEDHYFPCNGKGKNDWSAILAALDAAEYKGPFMFESHYEDVNQMQPCYLSLYNAYISHKKD